MRFIIQHLLLLESPLKFVMPCSWNTRCLSMLGLALQKGDICAGWACIELLINRSICDKSPTNPPITAGCWWTFPLIAWAALTSRWWWNSGSEEIFLTFFNSRFMAVCMENVPLINCAIPKDIMQVVLHKWHQTLSGRQVIEAGALVVEFPLVVVMVECHQTGVRWVRLVVLVVVVAPTGGSDCPSPGEGFLCHPASKNGGPGQCRGESTQFISFLFHFPACCLTHVCVGVT